MPLVNVETVSDFLLRAKKKWQVPESEMDGEEGPGLALAVPLLIPKLCSEGLSLLSCALSGKVRVGRREQQFCWMNVPEGQSTPMPSPLLQHCYTTLEHCEVAPGSGQEPCRAGTELGPADSTCAQFSVLSPAGSAAPCRITLCGLPTGRALRGSLENPGYGGQS